MKDIRKEIGLKIKMFRKKQKMTLDDLAKSIYKSKATVSKYENGEISIDIVTMYEIANALSVDIEQLLYVEPVEIESTNSHNIPHFFKESTTFFGYWYDGRNKSVNRMRFEMRPSENGNQQKIMMYMNFSDYEQYAICENTYIGTIEHFDVLSILRLENKYLPIEKASIQILASSLDSTCKWGLWNGLSTRPLMPMAAKILISNEIIHEDENLISMLKVSKEDIRLLKQYNMLTVL